MLGEEKVFLSTFHRCFRRNFNPVYFQMVSGGPDSHTQQLVKHSWHIFLVTNFQNTKCHNAPCSTIIEGPLCSEPIWLLTFKFHSPTCPFSSSGTQHTEVLLVYNIPPPASALQYECECRSDEGKLDKPKVNLTTDPTLLNFLFLPKIFIVRIIKSNSNVKI